MSLCKSLTTFALWLLLLGANTFTTTALAAAESDPAAESQAKPDKQPKYKKRTEEEKSLIDSVTDSIGDAVGLITDKVQNEGEEGVPRRIAVLPAVGQGDERERDDIRTVIHNNLSSKNFELLKPFDVDRVLARLEQTENMTFQEYDPQELAQKLDVEGLIFVDVPLVEQVYAAAYAHYKITVKLSFYSTFDQTFIWEKEESIAEREGGISLNPLSFIAQAISSAQVLTEAVRQTLVDKLARIFAADIPFPIGPRAKIKPVRIELALSNEGEGPFKAGEEITVVMRAEPGLAATFDIGNSFVGIVLNEQGEGEYVGRYVVNKGDNTDGLSVRINATRIEDRVSIVWSVPGRIKIDTVPPEPISQLVSSPVKDAVKLSWPAQLASHETLTYHIERADPSSGLYERIAAINISEYIDKAIVEGSNYHYRVYATDEAGNQSPFAQIQVEAVGVGPTDFDEDLVSDKTFYAVASPYLIKKPIRVLRGATLTLSPGTILKFIDKGKLEVLGKIVAEGTKQSPIVITGEPWQVVFSNTGENESRFAHTLLDNGRIAAYQSALKFNDVQFKAMEAGLKLSSDAKVSVNHSEFIDNKVGLWVEAGSAALDNVRFTANEVAWQVDGRQDFLATALRFEDNQIHIRSAQAMTIKNSVFTDLDYQTLLGKLEGDIAVDFAGVDDRHDLKSIWLKDRWMTVLDSAQGKMWQTAFDGLQPLLEHSTDDTRMQHFNQTLKFLTDQKVDQADEFLLAVQRFAQRNKNGEMFIQQIKLPYRANTINADAYIKKQAAKKLSGDYLKAQYPGLRAAELRKYRRKVKVDKDIVDSQVIYATKKGLFLHVWLANYLDKDKINRSLTLAGLVKKQNSALMIGLLSQTDVFEFEELLVQALKKQGINYISLGNGAYGKPAQAKAQKMGANIILETAVMVDENTSGISKNLKMVDVNLVLDVYDVKTNKVLDHLTASANAAGFKQREMVKKAVSEAYGTVESSLLSALWGADDVVAEHIKQEKIAQAKAEKARKAREAERKRKAKLAAARAAKAKAEKERLAKIAAEKAAADKAAAEKAAAEKAAAEKLAAEQAAKELAAKAQADDKANQQEPPSDSAAKSESVSSEIDP